MTSFKELVDVNYVRSVLLMIYCSKMSRDLTLYEKNKLVSTYLG